jgi:DNA-binding NarL/FixJ family response regulator
MSGAAPVLYWVTDLLFTSKIRETARQLGLEAQAVRDGDALVSAAPSARYVIVDLRRPGALELLERLAATAPSVPRAGFIDHEAVDVIARARALGCNALAKGKFSTELPRLLAAVV